MSLTLNPLPPSHLPRLSLDEASVSPPPPEIASHLAACDGCRTYVDALRQNAAEFLRSHPSDRFLGQVSRAQNTPSPRWIPAISVLASMAVGGIVAFAVWRGDAAGVRPGLQFKGSLVSTYVQRQGEAVQLRAGEALHPKDAVRFVVRAEQPGFAAVLERDSQGRVTVIAPFGAESAQPVGTGSTPLPDSAILDSTLGTDRFVAVLSPEPLALGPLVQSLSAGRSIDCTGCQVEILEFDKRP